MARAAAPTVRGRKRRWQTLASYMATTQPLFDPSMSLGWRRRWCAAVGAVVSDDDLVALILSQGIGPASFGAASLVCKSWLCACRSDERVLRGVARYQGGLTKGAFMKLFAITSKEADALPHSLHKRYGGGTYFLYRDNAVDAGLSVGGMEEWQRRLHLRAESPYVGGWPQSSDCFRLAARREERLHDQAVRRQALVSARGL